MDQGTQDPAQGGQAQDQGATPTGGQVQPPPQQPPQAQPAAAAGGQGAAAAGGQTQGDQGATPAGGQAAGTEAEGEESYLRPRPPDSELGIGKVGSFKTTVGIPDHPNTKFDEAYFLKMLSGSISLTKNEKKKIVESIPKLSQFQIDELIKIFEEERRKFAELDEKHQVKIRELQAKQADDWKDLEVAEKQEGKKEEDAAAAEALKQQLMGGGAAKSCPSCQAEITDEKATACPKCGAALEQPPAQAA